MFILIPTTSHAQPAFSPAQIDAALGRYENEPTIDALVQAALRTPLLDTERISDAITRARASGLIPQIRGDVRRGQTLDLSTLQYNSDNSSERVGYSSDDSLTLFASARFELDRLLFAPEETSLLRERRALETRRLEILHQLIRLYFERRRLQLERDLLGSHDVTLEVRILEAEALLDVLTDGAFSRLRQQSEDGNSSAASEPSISLSE